MAVNTPHGGIDSRDAEDNGPLTLVPGRRQRLGEQLYGQILEQIVSRRLQVGDRLPPEQEISRMFGVSRPIVRQALIRLRADGLLRARQGSGTFVMPHAASRQEAARRTADILVYLKAMEARLPIEAATARLAAERRSKAQLRHIGETQDRFVEICQARQETTAADADFHMALAEASGNTLFPLLLRPVLDMVEPFIDLHTDPGDGARAAMAEHQAILEAIRVQDAEAAEAAMRFHLSRARRRLTAQPGSS